MAWAIVILYLLGVRFVTVLLMVFIASNPEELRKRVRNFEKYQDVIIWTIGILWPFVAVIFFWEGKGKKK